MNHHRKSATLAVPSEAGPGVHPVAYPPAMIEAAVLTGVDLPPLGWNAKTRNDKFQPLFVDRPLPICDIKPMGGLWTSPVTGKTTAWAKWSRSEGKQCVREHVVITPDPAAKVFRINTFADLQALIAAFRREPKATEDARFMGFHVDWRTFSATFDALWVTEDGLFDAHTTTPWLRWDVESVWFANPVYTTAA